MYNISLLSATTALLVFVSIVTLIATHRLYKGKLHCMFSVYLPEHVSLDGMICRNTFRRKYDVHRTGKDYLFEMNNVFLAENSQFHLLEITTSSITIAVVSH